LTEPLLGGSKIEFYAPNKSIMFEPSAIILNAIALEPTAVRVSAPMAARSKICLLLVFCEQHLYSAIELKLKV
jgi:hypothetical protein